MSSKHYAIYNIVTFEPFKALIVPIIDWMPRSRSGFLLKFRCFSLVKGCNPSPIRNCRIRARLGSISQSVRARYSKFGTLKVKAVRQLSRSSSVSVSVWKPSSLTDFLSVSWFLRLKILGDRALISLCSCSKSKLIRLTFSFVMPWNRANSDA